MICPKCKTEVEYIPDECEFCPECGAMLQPEKQKNICPAEEKIDIPSLSGRSELMADAMDRMDLTEKSAGQTSFCCSCVRVEYNRNLFFLNGAQSVLSLRLTPLSGELKEFLLFMEIMQGQETIRKTIPVKGILTVCKPVMVTIPHQPDNIAGKIVFAFLLGCKMVNGDIRYFQFTRDFGVYDPKSSANAISSIIINQNQQITANQAADITYRDNLSKVLQPFAEKTAPSAYELIHRLNDLEPDYKEISLENSNWTPEQSLVEGLLYRTESLIIEWNGWKIYLLNKKTVKFGRSANKADIVVRAGGGKLSPQDPPNNTVSRLHAELLYCEDTVKIFDYSSYGTFINAKRPDDAGSPIPDQATIEFGDIYWLMNLQHCNGKANHAICDLCAAHNIKSVTFSRKDGEKEYYLLIWECCELGHINMALADWTIFTRNGCFIVRTPDQKFISLRPGHDVVSNGQTLHITFFNKQ